MLGHLLPELVMSRYKGNNGRVLIFGGSQEYTGAPYYSAVSALRAGADLSHIFCPDEALVPIKCYSPEIIVHSISNPIEEWLPLADSFVIGPGLGRTSKAFDMVVKLCSAVNSLQARKRTLVLDADALWFVAQSGELR